MRENENREPNHRQDREPDFLVFTVGPGFVLAEPHPELESCYALPCKDWRRSAEAFFNAVHPDDQRRVRQCLEVSDSTGCGPLRFRLRNDRTGRWHDLVMVLRHPTNPDPIRRSLEVIWMDVTRPAKLLPRLAKAHWGELLADMTTGYAHDLNNSLTGLGSLTELCLMELPADHPLRENLINMRDITREASGMTQLLGQLLMSKPHRTGVHDARALTEETVHLLRHALPRRVPMLLDQAEHPCPVRVDPYDWRAVLSELILNAFAGMLTRPSSITLKTGLVDSPEVRSSPWVGHRPGKGMVFVSVTDTGPGLGSDYLPAVFEPGFTTRPNRFGYGIGLKWVAETVAHWGGGLSFGPAQPHGCEVSFWLPAVDLDALTQADAGQAECSSKCGLILMGQETGVLDTLAKELTAIGRHPILVNPPRPAVELACAVPGRYAAVVFMGPPRPSEQDLAIWQPFRKAFPPVRLIVSCDLAGNPLAQIGAESLVDGMVDNSQGLMGVLGAIEALTGDEGKSR